MANPRMPRGAIPTPKRRLAAATPYTLDALVAAPAPGAAKKPGTKAAAARGAGKRRAT